MMSRAPWGGQMIHARHEPRSVRYSMLLSILVYIYVRESAIGQRILWSIRLTNRVRRDDEIIMVEIPPPPTCGTNVQAHMHRCATYVQGYTCRRLRNIFHICAVNLMVPQAVQLGDTQGLVVVYVFIRPYKIPAAGVIRTMITCPLRELLDDFVDIWCNIFH